MSADLFIYSPRTTVLTRGELRVVLESIGFFVLFSNEDREVLPDGPLHDEWLMALRRKDLLPVLTAALAAKDQAKLDQMSASKELACCTLYADGDFKPAEELADFEQRGDARIVEAISKARTKYHFNTSYRVSGVAWRFFEQGWRAVGKAIGGLLDDPQSGELTLIENSVETRLVRGRGAFSYFLKLLGLLPLLAVVKLFLGVLWLKNLFFPKKSRN